MRSSYRVTSAVMTIGWSVWPGWLQARAPHRSTSTASTSVSQAHRMATIGPRQGGFVAATEIYPWGEGSIFRIDTAPGRVTDVALEDGESLISVAAGDTARWIIGNTSSGTGDTRREHVLIKPSAAGLSTNILILTDRRSYHLDVMSNASGAMASVGWIYPKDDLMSLTKAAPAAPGPAATAMPADTDPTALNFDYAISGEDEPWRPVRAFDDGRHVYIEFPAAIGAGVAPPLFVTDGKAPELVNYRMRGRYYIVDRLFAHAELRLGDKPRHVVRIAHEARGGAS